MHTATHGSHPSLAFIDVGDFNGPPQPHDDAIAMPPRDPTYRLHPATSLWVSCIDGDHVARPLALDAHLDACLALDGLQHRAVFLTLHLSALTHDTFCWCHPRPSPELGLWTSGADY